MNYILQTKLIHKSYTKNEFHFTNITLAYSTLLIEGVDTKNRLRDVVLTTKNKILLVFRHPISAKRLFSTTDRLIWFYKFLR
jgi:hypothetical protein